MISSLMGLLEQTLVDIVKKAALGGNLMRRKDILKAMKKRGFYEDTTCPLEHIEKKDKRFHIRNTRFVEKTDEFLTEEQRMKMFILISIQSTR